jgi:hypothetical protein
MTLLLLAAGILVALLIVAGLAFMSRAGTDTGARATGEAPDPSEEREADRSRTHPRGVLEDHPPPA